MDKDTMKVTFNILRKDYELYKVNLVKLRRTPTSDLVGYIRDFNERMREVREEERSDFQ